jgi:hypothetical protein
MTTPHIEDILVGRSHLPDLCERLIETHRTLQMSCEYLHQLNSQNNLRAIDEIERAMQHIRKAIEATL